MTTRDKAAPEVAALTLVRGTPEVGDPVPEVSKKNREPDPYQVARQIVLRQLAMAPRSRSELMQKLEHRDCPAAVAATVLDRMAEVGLIDDLAYAQMLVRSQQSGRGLARRALARELRTKGIEDHLAEQALATISDEDERDRARALVDKKLRAMHGLGIDVQTRRLAGMLARKGYSSGVTFAIIREAIADAPEHLPD